MGIRYEELRVVAEKKWKGNGMGNAMLSFDWPATLIGRGISETTIAVQEMDAGIYGHRENESVLQCASLSLLG